MPRRTLLLIRHAKSSWKHAGLSDRDRPLAGRGKRDAPKMGKRLARRGLRPQLMLVSPAVRTLETARIMAKALGVRGEKRVLEPRLYECSGQELLSIVHELDDDVRRVAIIGHNPGLTLLAHRFVDSIVDLPTCAAVALEFDSPSWRQVDARRLLIALVG